MAKISQGPAIVTTQPQTLVVVNPFFDQYQEWSTDLFDCCDDVRQCKSCKKINDLIDQMFILSGFYAHFCWCCFLGSLAEKINESKGYGCCCGGNLLVAYRMKVRTALKIRVCLILF